MSSFIKNNGVIIECFPVIEHNSMQISAFISFEVHHVVHFNVLVQISPTQQAYVLTEKHSVNLSLEYVCVCIQSCPGMKSKSTGLLNFVNTAVITLHLE